MRYNINITIPLAPVAQKRPRFLRSSFRVYDPSAKDKKPFIKFFQENILNYFKNYFQNYKQNYKQIESSSKFVEFSIENAEKIFDFFPILNPVKIDIIFNYSRPKSHFLKAGNISKRFINNYPAVDIDNTIKFLLDVLQPQKNNKSYIGLIENDKQVIKLQAIKRYLKKSDSIPSINLRLYN